MSTDTIDSLTDAELSECFAVEICGWTRPKCCMPHYAMPPGRSEAYHQVLIPSFATDANTVLPWLEKEQQVSNVFEKGAWFVGIDRDGVEAKFVSAVAPTLARSACIALLRAKRAAK